MILRREIHIINGQVAGNGDAVNNTFTTFNAVLDATKYSGTLSAYFEILATNTSGTNRDVSLSYTSNANTLAYKKVGTEEAWSKDIQKFEVVGHL